MSERFIFDEVNFDDLIGKRVTLDLLEIAYQAPAAERDVLPAGLIIVEVHMPHVRKWNPKHDAVKSLVYRWPGGPLRVGDSVQLPKMPRDAGEHVGIVISTDSAAARALYSGPVRAVLGRV